MAGRIIAQRRPMRSENHPQEALEIKASRLAMAIGVERHEFDKTHDHAPLPSEGRERFHFIIVQITHEDSVYFCRSKRGVLRAIDAVHHRGKGFCAGNALESRGLQRGSIPRYGCSRRPHNPVQDRMAFSHAGLLYNGGRRNEKARVVGPPGRKFEEK